MNHFENEASGDLKKFPNFQFMSAQNDGSLRCYFWLFIFYLILKLFYIFPPRYTKGNDVIYVFETKYSALFGELVIR